jgi:hypothetical protein
MRIHAEPSGPPGARSALVASRSGMTDAHGETRMCYNCGETGHLIKVCPKSPNEINAGGRGQSGNCERGCGSRRGGRGGHRANLMVAKEVKEAIVGLSEEDLIMEIVRRRQKGASEGKSVVADTLALKAIPTTRSSDWIVDSGASRHVIGAAREFSFYTHLVVKDSIHTADGTVQPVVGKGTVRCTDSVTLTNMFDKPKLYLLKPRVCYVN